MANEIQVVSRLTVRKGALVYTTPTQGFSDTLVGSVGMTPGLINVPTVGVDVDLTALSTTPGYCEMTNLNLTHYVEVGVHDGSYFYPLAELPPGGKPMPFFLSRHIGTREAAGTSVGSTVTNFTLFLRAIGGPCSVIVLAFDR